MKNRILSVSLVSLLRLMLSAGAFAQKSNQVWSIDPEIGAAFSSHGKDADNSDY